MDRTPEPNTVLNSGMARVDGRETALAGCDCPDCPLPCLRKDPRLTVARMPLKAPCDHRCFFIPIERFADGA